MEEIWKYIVASYPTQGIEFVGTLLVQVASFWLPCFGYLCLDVLFPSYSRRHKLQPAPKQPSRSEIWHCFVVVTQNQLLSSCLHLFQIYVLKRGASSYRIESSLPSPSEFVRDFALSLLLREALFYYSHRFLHRPSFYARIHKRHHRFTAPIALAAQYAHPIEQVFANALPISLPPQILGSHILTFWAFLAYELFNTATVHSGYDFFKSKAKMHDLHHEKFNLNYGSIGLLDWLHGTDKLETRRKD
ncbi:sterol desaturase family protein [Aspergillus clavatus NRRL 1]|uniref:C-4 methylsterol oxidase, putative n=1 Tax=Aspergillus clavatus (strain ATCC 1007 / CBS 513.65 / DSM 816 / NCTC 3887 / NRRL 1 / QM 1276 / 107) TaxID=344612 RepID=A1CFU8_ASPCL|nr:C-4 methylsterol oxidase, putative [Aspergillus clavatus NRRL 1]EAW11747.1 C-4 methylsterol oxidase, putative [Aspergillus clavatus NRRL 1]